MIISICSHKGGVSKTQSSINIGHALSRQNKKVLLIDLDIQLNLTKMFPNLTYRYSLYDVLKKKDSIPIEKSIVATKLPNLHLIPNVSKLAILENETIQEGVSIEALSIMKNKIKESIHENFDYIIIDHPASLGILPLMALIASDQVIIPVSTGSNFSLEGVNEALNFVADTREIFNSTLKPTKLLLSIIRKRELAHRASLSIIKDKFAENRRFKTHIPAAAAIETAEMMKQTIFQFRSSAPVAKAFKAVSQEIMRL